MNKRLNSVYHKLIKRIVKNKVKVEFKEEADFRLPVKFHRWSEQEEKNDKNNTDIKKSNI